jgi:ferredoxin
VLGVDPDADEDAIEEAYRRRVKEAHPDQGGSKGEFLAVRSAYEELTVREGEDGDTTDAWTARRQSGAEGADAEEDGEDPGPRVEYLNYEVLDDHGWSIDDDDLFEKAAAAGLDPADHGRVRVTRDEPLLAGVEERGCVWPFACRGGACANCAVAVTEGDLSMPVDHILPDEMTDRGLRLSCVGAPVTQELRVVYNVKHLPDLDDLRLPPRPFEGVRADD